MTDKHTPGPWRVDGLLIKAIDHGKWFGIAKAGGSKLTTDGNIANALMIAAAPELLDALRMMVNTFHVYAPKFEGAEYKCVNDAYAAIARATGGTS